MRRFLLACIVVPFIGLAAHAQTGTPVVTDSRIKTFVYNENDVYSLLTHYGYQSNVEFGRSETVKTVSVGDRIAWQVVPAGRRLFIKAMEEDAHTNMTVVTNKRAYQFDLRSSGRVPLHPSEELVYVVRFFYPDETQRSASMAGPAVFSDPVQTVVAAPVAPVVVAPTPATFTPEPAPAARNLNFNYTLTGPDAIAPIRIYDDGNATYFTFPSGFNTPVQLFGISDSGQRVPLPASRNAQGELVVQGVMPRFAVQSGNQQVMVYNESQSSI